MVYLGEFIEGRARRFLADATPERVSHVFEREHECEKLGNALDRERHIRIARNGFVTIQPSQSDPELRLANLCQARNVLRQFTLGEQWAYFRSDTGQQASGIV